MIILLTVWWFSFTQTTGKSFSNTLWIKNLKMCTHILSPRKSIFGKLYWIGQRCGCRYTHKYGHCIIIYFKSPVGSLSVQYEERIYMKVCFTHGNIMLLLNDLSFWKLIKFSVWCFQILRLYLESKRKDKDEKDETIRELFRRGNKQLMEVFKKENKYICEDMIKEKYFPELKDTCL